MSKIESTSVLAAYFDEMHDVAKQVAAAGNHEAARRLRNLLTVVSLHNNDADRHFALLLDSDARAASEFSVNLHMLRLLVDAGVPCRTDSYERGAMHTLTLSSWAPERLSGMRAVLDIYMTGVGYVDLRDDSRDPYGFEDRHAGLLVDPRHIAQEHMRGNWLERAIKGGHKKLVDTLVDKGMSLLTPVVAVNNYNERFARFGVEAHRHFGADKDRPEVPTLLDLLVLNEAADIVDDSPDSMVLMRINNLRMRSAISAGTAAGTASANGQSGPANDNAPKQRRARF